MNYGSNGFMQHMRASGKIVHLYALRKTGLPCMHFKGRGMHTVFSWQNFFRECKNLKFRISRFY
jgi:hypothetical protein